MNKLIIKLYHGILQHKIRLDMELAKYKVRNSPGILADESAVFFPETQIIAPFAPNKVVIGPKTFVRGQLQCIRNEGEIRIGRECYIGNGTHIWSAKSILVGDRVLIAHNCNIFDSTTHPMDARERNDDFINICIHGKWNSYSTLSAESVVIEDDVWIGCNCTILKGVTIGKGAIIGAGSVVTKNVDSYAIVAGNPIRQIGRNKPGKETP